MKTDASVVILSHPSVQGMTNGSGYSGSTAWNGSVRSRLYFDRVKSGDGKTEEDPDLRVLKTMKANYGPSGQQVLLRWNRGVFEVAGGDESAESHAQKRAAEYHVDAKFLELLAAFTAQGRSVGEATSKAYAPAQFAADPNADGISSKGFEQAMRRLFGAKKIRIEETGPASRRRGRIVAA